MAIIMRPAAAQAPGDLFYLPPDSEVGDGDDFIIPPDSDVIGLPPGDGIIDGPPVPAEVHFLFPYGTAKPAFCPRRKLPLEDEKALIVAGYYPPTEGVGTFTWSSTVDGGSVARAWEHDTVPLRAYGWFSSHTPAGGYGARVRYDKNGTSDQDDGGPIKVFDAELTFDGHGANDPDYTPEESPGFYMAREGPRKELALEFWPEDLSSYLPGGMPRIPPPIVITLSRSNEYVQLYSAPTGGDPVTNLHWGWEVGQGGVPFWDEPPEHLYVQANLLGTCDLTLMLTYFQTWFPEPPIPTSISATDKVRVNVISAVLNSVYFVSDHGVLRDWAADFAGYGETVYDPRGGRRAPAANNPVSHTKNVNVTVDVNVTIAPPGVEFSLVGASDVYGLCFVQQGTSTSTAQPQTIRLTSLGPIDPTVAVLQEPIDWYAVIGSNSVALGASGPHEVYVTWGAPGPGPTLKRVNWVCTQANGAATLEGVADALWDAVAAETVFGGGGTDGWALLDGGTGDCDNQAYCMELAVEMPGAGPAEVQCVRASVPPPGAGTCLNQEDRPGPPHQWLVLDFDTGAGYNWNAWEGCCETADHYYAITPKKKADNDYQMLLVISCQQYWVETDDDIEPGEPEWHVKEPPVQEEPKP